MRPLGLRLWAWRAWWGVSCRSFVPPRLQAGAAGPRCCRSEPRELYARTVCRGRGAGPSGHASTNTTATSWENMKRFRQFSHARGQVLPSLHLHLAFAHPLSSVSIGGGGGRRWVLLVSCSTCPSCIVRPAPGCMPKTSLARRGASCTSFRRPPLGYTLVLPQWARAGRCRSAWSPHKRRTGQPCVAAAPYCSRCCSHTSHPRMPARCWASTSVRAPASRTRRRSIVHCRQCPALVAYAVWYPLRRPSLRCGAPLRACSEPTVPSRAQARSSSRSAL